MIGSIGRRIQEVDLLRGFAAICVVIGHSFITTPIDISGVPWCHHMYQIINSFHMEMFFLLGGFVYHCVNYKKYIKGKIWRIMVPYFFFGIIALFLHSYGGDAVNRHTPLLEGIKNMFFYGGSYWFLYTMFIIFAIFPLIEKLCNTTLKMLIFILVLVLIQVVITIPSILTLNSIIYYLPYFAMGYLIRNQYDNVYKKFNYRGVLCIIILLSLVLFITTYCFADAGVIINYILGISGILFFGALTLLHTYVHPQVMKSTWGGFRSLCSEYSLQIYLFNGFILVPTRIVLCKVLHITSPIIIVLAIVIIDLMITLVLCKYLIPKVKLAAKLCGIKEAIA